MNNASAFVSCLVCGFAGVQDGSHCPVCKRKIYRRAGSFSWYEPLADLLEEWKENSETGKLIPQYADNLRREMNGMLEGIEVLIIAYRDLPVSCLAPLIDRSKAGCDLFLAVLAELEKFPQAPEPKRFNEILASASWAQQEIDEAMFNLNQLKNDLGVDQNKGLRDEKGRSIPEIEFYYAPEES